MIGYNNSYSYIYYRKDVVKQGTRHSFLNADEAVTMVTLKFNVIRDDSIYVSEDELRA